MRKRFWITDIDWDWMRWLIHYFESFGLYTHNERLSRNLTKSHSGGKIVPPPLPTLEISI